MGSLLTFTEVSQWKSSHLTMGGSLSEWNCLKVGATALQAIKDGTPMNILFIFHETHREKKR